MRLSIYIILVSSLVIFSMCVPKSPVEPVFQPILNATVKGVLTNKSNNLPLVGVLIMLKKDTMIVDSVRTSALGNYQFHIIDKDTTRQYYYTIDIPFTGKLYFYEATYIVNQDSIQIQNFSACPLGFLLMTFSSKRV